MLFCVGWWGYRAPSLVLCYAVNCLAMVCYTSLLLTPLLLPSSLLAWHLASIVHTHVGILTQQGAANLRLHITFLLGCVMQASIVLSSYY